MFSMYPYFHEMSMKDLYQKDSDPRKFGSALIKNGKSKSTKPQKSKSKHSRKR